MTPEQYWSANNALEHITPPGERFPEVNLSHWLGQACYGSVFEFGCGDGRLSPFFLPSAYYGYDINQSALDAASIANPDHEYGDEWRDADTFLAYTVLLHLPDSAIQDVIDQAIDRYSRVVIGEIMGRKWRRDGNPPVFNRELSEYEEMAGSKAKTFSVRYPRYGCDLTLAVFE